MFVRTNFVTEKRREENKWILVCAIYYTSLLHARKLTLLAVWRKTEVARYDDDETIGHDALRMSVTETRTRDFI